MKTSQRIQSAHFHPILNPAAPTTKLSNMDLTHQLLMMISSERFGSDSPAAQFQWHSELWVTTQGFCRSNDRTAWHSDTERLDASEDLNKPHEDAEICEGLTSLETFVRIKVIKGVYSCKLLPSRPVRESSWTRPEDQTAQFICETLLLFMDCKKSSRTTGF